MRLTMQVVDPQGKGISNISLQVKYADAPPSAQPGQTTTIKTDTKGTGLITSFIYSGDHFVITPNDPAYTFNPPQIGSNANIGGMEMNTNFSTTCGTQLENGTSMPPCKFTATAIPGKITSTPTIPPLPPTTQPAFVTNNPAYYSPSISGFLIAFAILCIGALIAAIL